jgi:hypothetical protein
MGELATTRVKVSRVPSVAYLENVVDFANELHIAVFNAIVNHLDVVSLQVHHREGLRVSSTILRQIQ